MNITITTPDDETPQPQPGLIVNGQNITTAIDAIKAEHSQAQNQLIQAARETANDITQGLVNSYSEVTSAALQETTQTGQKLATAVKSVAKPLNKLIDDSKRQLEDGYVELHSNGVNTPITMDDYITDLMDGSGVALASRVPSIGGNPAQVINSSASPLLIKPATRVGSDPLIETPPLFIVPPSPPPISPPCVHPKWVYAQLVNGKYTCPTGYGLVTPADGQPYCVLQDQSAPCPDTNWQEILPPVSPPPTVPPTVPPIVPPIVPPPIGECTEPQHAVQIECFTAPPAKPPVSYWVTADCTDPCKPMVCIWKGELPPQGYHGSIVLGPLDTKPTRPDIIAAVTLYCPSVQIPPPLVPPAVPPTSPPPPPDICIADMSTARAAGILSPDANVKCVIPPPDVELQLQDIESFGWSSYADCDTVHTQTIKCIESGIDACLQQGKPMTITGKRQTWPEFVQENGWMFDILTPFVDLVSPKDTTGTAKEDAVKKEATKAMKGLDGVITLMLNKITSNTLPNPHSAFSIGTILGLANRIELITGFPMSYCMKSTEYLNQFANPQFIPGQPELDSLWLNNRINHNQWECYTKANGNQPTLFRPIRNSKTVRPDVMQIISLYRRGLIDSEQTMYDRMRENGVTVNGHAKEMYALSDELPHVDDLIRFMVRDVFDADTVGKYNLDAGFDKKWVDQSKKWGKAAGLSDEIALLQWRAHWKVPSDTSLYTMVHRLRPDRAEVTNWDFAPGPIDADGNKPLIGKRPPTFSVADLKYALEINDNVPTFVDKLTAISYHPITNSDASRAFNIGFFSERQLKASLQDNGYEAAVADTMVDYYKSIRSKQMSNLSGVWTPRKVVTALKKGVIDEIDARQLLKPNMVSDDIIDSTINGAMFEVTADTKDRQMRALKKRYMYGEYSSNELSNMWQQIGIDPKRIPKLLDQWEADRKGRSREPRAAQLCDWFQRNFITLQQYSQRLTRLGYTDTDVANIIKTCTADGVRKAAKLAADAARTAQRQADHEYQVLQRGVKEQQALLKLDIENLTKQKIQLQIELDEIKLAKAQSGH